MQQLKRRFIRLFDEITADDVALVGGKTASLVEMYRALRPRGVLVPSGFAITAEAYRHVLTQAHAWDELHATLDGVSVDDMDDLARRGRRAREIVYSAGIPEDLKAEILDAYRTLDPGMLKMLKLAVEGCRHNGVHSGICGQAPSDYPEIAAELVRLGIESISVNPDTVVKTTLAVLCVERQLAAQECRDVA